MIDMHSHILPNIDDGSRSMEETYNLIKEANKAGFEAIVATPHYIEGYYETDAIENQKIFDEVYENVQKEYIKLKMYLANEIYLSDNIIKLIKENKANTINNTKYILFEMPLNAEPMNLYDVVYEILQQEFYPILAHPERYSFIQKKPEIVYELIQKGVLMQANYASILGIYGKRAKKTVKILLKNNMIHLLGSDTHRENTIYTKMPIILKKLNKIIGEAKMQELTNTNPKLILNNKPLVIDHVEELKNSIFKFIS